MAVKRYNKQMKHVKFNDGYEMDVELYTTDTQLGYCEHAVGELYPSDDRWHYTEFKGRITWQGRDWQSFDYERAMKYMIDKLPKNRQETARKVLIERTEQEETEKWDKIEKAFTKAHEALSENGKRIFAENAPMMNNENDVKQMTALMGLAALIGL